MEWRFDLFTIGAAGGSEFSQLIEGFTACQRFSEDQLDEFRRLWTDLAEGLDAGAECGKGYAYTPYGSGHDDRSCAEAWGEQARRHREKLRNVRLTYYAESGPVRFFWDLESPLPSELERSFSGTLGILCGESGRLSRDVRRRLPAVAAMAGC